jgi:ubiquinone/menaquinone biosynthesis C-methylase UbiE
VPDFEPIADALRGAVEAFFDARGQSLASPSGQNTLDTNSILVARRGRPLIRFLGADPRPGADGLAGRELLDVGCGFGALALLFAAHGARVTALDPSEERLAVGHGVAERFGLPVTFMRAPMHRIPLPDAAFDVAVLNNSLCYIVAPEDRRLGLVEVRRTLKPGGQVMVRNPNRWAPTDQFTGLPLLHMLPPAAATAAAARLGRRRSEVRLQSPPAAARELRTAGFVDVRHHGFLDSARPQALKIVARYQHFTAVAPRLRSAP